MDKFQKLTLQLNIAQPIFNKRMSLKMLKIVERQEKVGWDLVNKNKSQNVHF